MRFASYSMRQSCLVFLCALVLLLSGCAPDKNSVGTTDTEENSAVPAPTPTPQALVMDANKAPSCSDPAVTELVVSILIPDQITYAQSLATYSVARRIEQIQFEAVPEGADWRNLGTNEKPHWMAFGGKCDLGSETVSNPNTDQERLSVDGETFDPNWGHDRGYYLEQFTVAKCEEQRKLFSQWIVRREERETSIKAKKAAIDSLLLPAVIPHGTVRSVRTLSSADSIKKSTCAAFFESRTETLEGVRALMDQEEDEAFAKATGEIIDDLSGMVVRLNKTESITYTAQVTDASDEVIVEVVSKEAVAIK